MSRREIRVHQLVGRKVRDADGRYIGRIQELQAEIELHERGNVYVVVAFHVGRFGLFESLAGSRFAWQALRFLGHRSLTIPWQQMDLSDPVRPRLTQRIDELSPRQ